MSGRSVEIGSRSVGAGQPPMIIAEMSGNHNRSLERAIAIVDAAADAGAHALKLQTYTPDTMTLDLDTGDFLISDPGSLWNGRTLYELYREAQTPREWHRAIFERCRTRGLICFSTPFDESAVDFLEELECPCYKIASFENTDLPLLRKVAATGKPVLMSTGMAGLADLEESTTALRASGCRDLILLKCTSTYPADANDSNLVTIPHMRALFGCEVGLSDHTFGIGAAIASVALGARVIEKHFTLSRADGGVDAAFSLEPSELSALVVEARRAWEALGSVHYGAVAAEEASRRFRRSLYVTQDVRAGQMLTEANVRALRPGAGLPPRALENVLGKRVKKDVKRGTPVHWDMLDW